MLKLDSLLIEGIGGIRHLPLRFQSGLNLICGPNGVGKSTVLECIAHAFAAHSSSVLRRNVQVETGFFELTYESDGERRSTRVQRTKYHPREGNEYDPAASSNYDRARHLVVFKTYRDITYKPLDAINRDPDFSLSNYGELALAGTQSTNLKNWFINRYLWSAHPNHLSAEQVDNLELAKACFSMLDENVSFGGVVSDSHDILVTTPDGKIYYEYLSSGYKSCLFVLLGLVKEVEFRYKTPYLRVQDFDGVVLIDELDLHLHPEWQAKLLSAIMQVLPKAQIVATTHSPHMLQVAQPNQIIPLGFNKQGQVVVRQVPQSPYGYQGWTIEEILRDVMGLESLRSPLYHHTLQSFEVALRDEHIEGAVKAYEVLSQMLHPHNPIRKLLRIQLAGIGGSIS